MAKEIPKRENLRKHVLAQTAVKQVVSSGGTVKRQAEQSADGSTSQQEYAETAIQEKTADTAATMGNAGTAAMQNAYRRYAVIKRKKRNTTADAAEQAATEIAKQTIGTAAKQILAPETSAKTLEFATPEVRLDKIRRETYGTRVRAIISAHSNPAHEPPVKPKVQISGYKAKFQKLRKQQMIRAAVKQHLEKRAQAGAAGTAAKGEISVAAPKLPGVGWKHTMRERISHTLQMMLLKIQALLARTLKTAAKSLLSLLGAGGVVLLLAMVIGASAAIIGSPMGILFADESGDPNAIPIAEIVQETNREFAETISELVAAHPECSEVEMQYDYEDGHTWSSYWPEVLAVFAVDTNLNSDSDVVVVDEAKREQINATFWEMHEIESEVEQVKVTPAHVDEYDPEIWHEAEYRYILHITVSSRSVEELAVDKHFTADQMDILHELLSDEMRPMLAAMCGGLVGGDGTLQWPLPGYSNITTCFGEPDAFGRPGHRGIDIAAGEGTPIFAAHGGTVLVSGWNDSYGNQVMLDDGAGTSTRYAHMITTAVSAGETVSAGQVIGYVGSTGDSTGNHLHFELYLNGQRMNPLDYVAP